MLKVKNILDLLRQMHVCLIKSFLFTDTSKNDCFTNVLDIRKYFFIFMTKLYQIKGTFGRYIAKSAGAAEYTKYFSKEG